MNPPAKQILSIPRDLAVLSLSMFIWGLGEGLFIYFYPLALQSWNADPVLTGSVLSLIGVSMALVQIPAGYLSDRLGTRPLILAACGLGVAAVGVMSVAPSLTILVIGMIGYGITSFVSAPLNKYTTNARQNWSVQRAMTFVSGSYQAGAILGPLLGGRIGQSEGFSTVFRYAAVLLLVSTLVMLFTRRVESPEEQEVTPRLSPLANPRFLGLLAIFFFSTFSLSMPQQLASLYLQEVHHLSLEQIGLTGTLAGMGTAVIMFTCGGLKPPLGVITGQLFLGLFCLLLWQGHVPGVFYAGYLFIGGYRLYRSMALASVRPLVKSGDLGLAYGLVETGNAAAVTLAPLAAGILYNYQAGAIFSVGLAALVLMMAVNAFFLLRKPVTH